MNQAGTESRTERYRVSVEQYVAYQRQGFVKVGGLLPAEDVRRLVDWTDDMYQGNIEIKGMPHSSSFGQDESGRLERLLASRFHMPHRHDATAEWGILHPRVLDVLEALIGPDVLALQSMIFFNPPGTGGQGWHQDAYYITTYPDTLIGVWIAIDEADEDNGCLWVVPGSNHEPIYPDPPQRQRRFVHAREAFDELPVALNASHLDDEQNSLAAIVRKYPPAVPVPMKSGDVLFFHSHLLHRSYPNRTKDRFRRSYVNHYCNARSWVPWNHGTPYEGDSANGHHILARGQTHMPFAAPVFGTRVELAAPPEPGAPQTGTVMMGMDGMMMPGTAGQNEHDD